MSADTFKHPPVAFADAVADFLENFAPEYPSDLNADDAWRRAKASWPYSLRCKLIAEVAAAAARYADECGEPEQFLPAANRGVAVVNELAVALVTPSSDEHFTDAKHWNFWRHVDAPLDLVKQLKSPHIYRDGVVEAATQYLALPYRTLGLERTLVDVLMAAECFAFGELVAVASRVPFPVRHLLASYNYLNPPNTFVTYLIENVLNAVVVGIPTAAAVWAINALYPENSAASWIIGGASLLWGILFILSTAMLPARTLRNRKTRARTAACLEAALSAYGEIAPGVVSAVRIREAAARASESGVVWPGAVFALLDDNISRNCGRL